MDDKEDENSDSGSYELIDFDGYESDQQIQNVEVDVLSNMDHSDDGSYEFVPSEDFDKLVLTEGEASSSTTDSEDNMAEDSKSGCYEEPFSDSEFPDGLNVGDNPDYVPRFLTLAFPHELPAEIMIRSKCNLKIKDVVKNHVLPYLPAKSLARSRLVSKEWDQWITNPFLAHTQGHSFRTISGFFTEDTGRINFISLDRSAYGVPFPPLRFLAEVVTIKSSCNGLLLCQGSGNRSYVCNPVNKEWVSIPSSGYHHGDQSKFVLAFEPSSLNFEPCYHVICAFRPELFDVPCIYFDIYDSKKQSWKASEMMCFDLDVSNLEGDGFFMDGVVYWETTGGELLAFDLKNEIYGVQTLPFGRSNKGTVSKVHSELCYLEAHYHHSTKMCIIDVYEGVPMSLRSTIAFNVSLEDLEDVAAVECIVLPSYCDDVVAVLLRKYLFVYHVRSQKLEGPTVVSTPDYWYMSKMKFFPYVNSLVSVAAK